MTDKRREERVAVALPIFLDDATGITRDVSASGIFFEINTRFSVGDPVSCTVEFDAPGGKRLLKCAGNIVRTEQHDDRTGVAIRVVESTMGISKMDYPNNLFVNKGF